VSTVAVIVSEYVLWSDYVAPLIKTDPLSKVLVEMERNAGVGVSVKVGGLEQAGDLVTENGRDENGCTFIPTSNNEVVGMPASNDNDKTTQYTCTVNDFNNIGLLGKSKSLIVSVIA
jgi:hypothetical protein